MISGHHYVSSLWWTFWEGPLKVTEGDIFWDRWNIWLGSHKFSPFSIQACLDWLLFTSTHTHTPCTHKSTDTCAHLCGAEHCILASYNPRNKLMLGFLLMSVILLSDLHMCVPVGIYRIFQDNCGQDWNTAYHEKECYKVPNCCIRSWCIKKLIFVQHLRYVYLVWNHWCWILLVFFCVAFIVPKFCHCKELLYHAFHFYFEMPQYMV